MVTQVLLEDIFLDYNWFSARTDNPVHIGRKFWQFHISVRFGEIRVRQLVNVGQSLQLQRAVSITRVALTVCIHISGYYFKT